MKHSRPFILLLCCCWQQLLPAQPGLDEAAFRSLSPAQRCRFIHDLEPEKMDSVAFVAAYGRLNTIAGEKKDKRANWLLRFYRFQQRDNLNLTADDNIRLLSELEKTAAENGWEAEEIVARHFLVFEKYYAERLPLGALYTNILEEMEVMRDAGFEKFADYRLDWMLYHNAKFMYELEDFDKAFQIFQVAAQYIQATDKGRQPYVLVLNHLQSIHQKREDLPTAIDYAHKIRLFAEHPPTTDPEGMIFYRQWQGLVLLDLAAMLVKQGKLTESEALAQKGYELSKSYNAIDRIALRLEYDALQVLALTKLELRQPEELPPLLHRLDELYEAIGGDYENYFNNIEYFDCRSRYHEMKGQYAEAIRYANLAKPLQDSLARRNDARKLEQLKHRLEAEKYTEQIRLIENEKELQKWLRNAAFAILALVLLLAYGWFHRQRHLRRQKEAELEAARADLATMTQGFREKSDMAANLRLEMDKLAAAGERSQYLEQLMQSTILTDDDWLRFRTLFEKVHPGFVEEQKALYPDLTPAELRYLVLEKLQLSTHEMANMLGVSDNTIRQTRVRLRRKIG